MFKVVLPTDCAWIGPDVVDDGDVDELTGWANVVAIDPGVTSGWSVFTVHPDALVIPDYAVLDNVEYWEQGEYGGRSMREVSQVALLADLLEAWPDAAVVVEDFILRRYRKDRDLLSPVRITAMLEYAVSFSEHPRPMFLQSASMGMTAVDDVRLHDWGFYRADGMEHARDATRHALTFLKRCADVNTNAVAMRRAAWPRLYRERK